MIALTSHPQWYHLDLEQSEIFSLFLKVLAIMMAKFNRPEILLGQLCDNFSYKVLELYVRCFKEKSSWKNWYVDSANVM